MGNFISENIAGRHEALFVRLAALAGQIDAIAARRPDAGVPEGLRVTAEGLLFDARPFLVRRPRRALPVAAPDYAGLATQLGQALAGLVAYETQHCFWSEDMKAFLWRVAGEEPRLVLRLRPQASLRVRHKHQHEMENIRRRLEAGINALTKGEPRAGETGAAPPETPAPAPARPVIYPRVQNLS